MQIITMQWNILNKCVKYHGGLQEQSKCLVGADRELDNTGEGDGISFKLSF